MIETITILTALQPQTKTIRTVNGKLKVEASNVKAKYFRFDTRVVSDIYDLSKLLNALETDAYSFVIRGELALDVDPTGWVRRRIRAQHQPDGHFEEFPHRWLMLDVDGADIPDMDLIGDPESAIEDYIGRYLPPAFHEVTCHWYLTSSAGIKPGLRARLVFWLDKRLWQGELKRLIGSFPESASVDSSTVQTVQPIYTAAPIVEKGTVDPIPLRSGLMERERDVVQVLIPSPNTPKHKASQGTAIMGNGLAHYLSQIGDHEGGRGIHAPIRDAIASAAHTYGESLDADWLKLAIRNAVSMAEIHNRDMAYVYKKTSDRELDREIQVAIAKFGKARRKSPVSDMLIKSIPPVSNGKPLTAAEASPLLAQHVADFFKQPYRDEEPRIVLIEGAAGLGKTHEVIKQICELVAANDAEWGRFSD